MIKPNLDAFGVTLLIGLCLLFGFNQVVIKFALEGISPIMQAGLRSIGATFLLCCWMRGRGETIFRSDGASLWGVLAGVLFAGEFICLYLALEKTTASHATVFLYTSPFVVALGAHLFIPGERLRLIQVLGLVCAFIGVVVAFSDSMGGEASLAGDLLAVLGAVFWGATTVILRASPQRHLSASRVLLYQLAVSAVLLPILSLLLGEPGIVEINSRVLAAMAFQIVMMAFIGYLGWFWLLSRYPASRVATFVFMTPLFGVLSAWLILDEALTFDLAGALLLVAFGIYLVNRPGAKEAN